jgi:PAS domain S-box-containing protein
MITQEGCLKCHAFQGYKVGDVRGGVGVSLSLAPLLAFEREHATAAAATLGVIWALGLAGFCGMTVLARRRKLERERAETALRESEEKYRGIFDDSVATIYVFDTHNHFLDSNQAGLNLLGYSREELLRLSIPDVDADPEGVLPAHQQLLSGGRLINYEHRLRRKDGAILTVLVNSRQITDSNGNVVGMQSTLLDITQRKQAEQELALAHRRATVLAQLGRELAEADAPRTAAMAILDAARRLLGWDCA